MKQNLNIVKAWNIRSKLQDLGVRLKIKSNKLRLEANKLRNKTNKLQFKLIRSKEYDDFKKATKYKLKLEGDKLVALAAVKNYEANMFRVKGNQFCAQGDLIFINSVIKEYGDISIKWKSDYCYLENGEVYENI
jgi:hypothetical protein